MISRLFCLLLIVTSAGIAQSPVAVINRPAPNEAALRKQSFDKVWNTVNENHFDPTFGGVDWNKVRTRFEPIAMKAASNNDFHAVLRKMLAELKLSHFSVFPDRNGLPDDEERTGVTGIDLIMIDGVPVIKRVEPSSSALAGGVKAGFIVERIGGETVSKILEPLEKYLAATPMTNQLKRMYRERALVATFDGDPGTTAKLELLNGQDRSQVFLIERKRVKSEMSKAIGNFPPQEVLFESRLLPNNIGYIRFNMWLIPQMPKIRKAISLYKDSKGLIIDLRGNPGGIGGMAGGVAGHLVKRRTSLGTMNGRSSKMEFIAYPQDNAFTGPLVLLTDHGSGSTSEVFAAGLQEVGRAKIVGDTTAGAVLPSVFDKLPTGAIFQYAISDYRSPKKVLIEGHGVAPDVKVLLTRAQLLHGRDSQLDAAIKFILHRSIR
ncbi:MAG: S41 family peptidase [Pyrinomonadaceae bacterium]